MKALKLITLSLSVMLLFTACEKEVLPPDGNPSCNNCPPPDPTPPPPPPPPPIETDYISVNPNNQIRLCPTWINGDRDFGGIAEVEATVTILIKSGNQLWRKVEFEAREPNPDYSTAKGLWEDRIYTAPSGWKIQNILSNTSAHWAYTDEDHNVDVATSNNPAGPVYKMEAKGDTGGNDIGNCTTDDAYLSVYYNSIQIKIIED